MEIPDETVLSKVKELRRAGRPLDAWNLVRHLAPPEQWGSAEARRVGALLVEQLGDPDRAQKIVFKEWKNPESRALMREDMFWEVLQMRGAYLAWKWLQQHAPAADEAPRRQVAYLGFQGYVLIKLRDFERAEECLNRGQELRPDDRWFALLRADLRQEQDLREEALVLAEEVVKADPEYITGQLTKAELLQELGRDEDSIETMRAALQVVQSGSIARRLAGLLVELGRHDEVEQVLSQYEELMPLRDESCQDWLCSMRCDLASHRRDHETTLHWARQVRKGGFHKKLVTKLEAAAMAEWRRVILPVPFVQQHHNTCAPASLTSILIFWQCPVEHVDVADEICYDGTPDYRERDWAEREGWAVREFRVTVESARCLIDAGMPFVLNTVYPGGAHAQVVMGYDDHRDVLFIRDPGNRHTSEFLALESLEEQLPFGPRGFVMVPQEHAARLASLSLPDTAGYDAMHRLQLSLSRHDRKGAQAALAELRAAQPETTLRWRAEYSLARYDAQHSQQLEALEQMLKRHPDVEDWRTSQMHMINQVHGREAMLAQLTQVCAAKDSHPLHWQMLARELHWDERRYPEARRLIRRVSRRRQDSAILACEADMLWRDQRFEEATEIYRLAACLNWRSEDSVMAYFKATRWVKKTEDALRMMRRHLALEGKRSSQPAVILHKALDMLRRCDEGLQVLTDSLKARPEDVEHAVYVAGELARWNRSVEAQAILDSITSGARAAEWHRVKARIALMRGDHAGQMEHQRAILADNPLDADAHRNVANLLDMQEGGKSGLRFLQEACQRFRWHWSLHMAWLDWARDAGADEWEKPVIELLRIDPHDAWARREMADVLCAQGKFEEAHRELDESAKIDSRNVSVCNVRAGIFESAGRVEEAHAEYRRAVALDVDNEIGLRGLVRCSRGQPQRIESLRIIQAELRRQVTIGDGLLEFGSLARAVLEPEEVGACLREAFEGRPDLWHTHMLMAEHLRQTGHEHEAVEITTCAVQKFPLLPRLWLEHALNLEADGRRVEAIQAAAKSRELHPAWGHGMRTLSEMMRKEGDYAGAREVLEELIRHKSTEGFNHGWLAEVQWDLDERAAAIASLIRAVQLDPGYGWAWDRLEGWGTLAGQPEAVREATQRLIEERPGEARTWMIAAERLYEPHDVKARLTALDKAISLAPKSWGPVDAKAALLGRAGRFDEALALCRSHVSGAPNLRFREGWLLSELGRRKEAIKVLEDAVADDPRHEWPWRMLIEIFQDEELHADAERACRQLARLQSDEPMPLGYLAGVLISQKKIGEAKETLAEAVDRFPHYEFAFQRLFWLYIEDSEWDNIVKLLNSRAGHYSEIHLRSRWFIYHCRRSDWEQAGKELMAVLEDLEEDEPAYVRVHEELKRIPVLQRTALLGLLKTAREALRRPLLNPLAGKLYVQICRQVGALPFYEALADLPNTTTARMHAFVETLHLIGERWERDNKSLLRWLKLNARKERALFGRILKNHRQWLREDPDLYGAVCYALHASDQSRETVAWLSDWRDRGLQIKPYILNNLLLALQETNQKEEAHEVMWHGITLGIHDDSKMRFHIWCAIERLLVGDSEQADKLMNAVNPASLSAYSKKLLEFQGMLRDYQEDRFPSKRSFASASVILERFMDQHAKNPVMMDNARRAVGLISRRLGSIWPRCWYAGYQIRHVLTVPW